MLRRLVWRSSALLSTILMFTSGKPSICYTSFLKSKPENSTVKCTHKRQKKKIIAWKDIAEKNHPRQNVRFSFVPTQVKCPWQTKELRGETATTISWGWKENEKCGQPSNFIKLTIKDSITSKNFWSVSR
jgi:hypothetical protein